MDLMDFAQAQGVSNHLVFAGERKDIPALLSIMDIVVNASFSEGMSNTILEAMAAAKLVIASDVGGNRGLIKDGQTGLLFPTGDSTVLAKLIVNVLNHKEKNKSIATKAQEFVKTRHDLATMCRQNMNLYLECIEAQA